MLSEGGILETEDNAEEQVNEEARATYEDYGAMLHDDDEEALELLDGQLVGAETTFKSLQAPCSTDAESTDTTSDTLPESFLVETYPLPPANLTIRHALSYDSDELTDTDAEGSYELYSDDEADQNATVDDDEDVQDVLSQLQELRVESTTRSPVGFVEDEEEEQSGSELDSVEHGLSFDIESIDTEVEAEAEVEAQVEESATEEDVSASPATFDADHELSEVEEMEAEKVRDRLVDEQPVQVEMARENETERDYQRGRCSVQR